jgi:uncharacterized protein HemX
MFSIVLKIFSFIKNFPVIFTIGTILAGLISVAYVGWKHQIEQTAQLEFNQQQLLKVIEDEKNFQEKMRSVQEAQKSIADDVAKQNQAIDDKLKSLDAYLNSKDTLKNDRPASIILKNTINQLGNTK